MLAGIPHRATGPPSVLCWQRLAGYLLVLDDWLSDSRHADRCGERRHWWRRVYGAVSRVKALVEVPTTQEGEEVRLKCTKTWFIFIFFFSSRRRHTRCSRDWSSDVCSSDYASLLIALDRFGAPYPEVFCANQRRRR